MLTLILIIGLLVSTPAAAILYCHKTFCPPPQEEIKQELKEIKNKEKKNKKGK